VQAARKNAQRNHWRLALAGAALLAVAAVTLSLA
jgi:hypothetical protein